ncbi:amino acid adenylation domain-containing protein [Citroniella saccharovorans]|uniref:Amino acid adenylation domain-containing protein n=1 Tax=Citroniella saccharovorans TaxID=2053367 RepID=A0AAW9MNI9_9FIRM|nr:amino acid adenylation domain-containing protein [Citroniella saccharovorans]MEB3428571.1 amino acid adenylation domain-containing protein [Citroniella saccharovorans]
MEKSVFQIAAVVGVLMSGSSYVPIEIDLPDKRKEEVARQADIDFILNMNISDNVTNVKNYNLACIFEDSDFNHDEEQNMIEGDNLDDTAYVIFTSGSTGLPKGVEVSHRAVMNTIMDINSKFSISKNDVFIGISKLSFDLSVYDIFSSLSLGATLIIPNSNSIDPEYWYDLIKKNKVSVWNTVPAIMQLFLNYMFENKKKVNLRKILLSGDWIPTDLPDKIRKISNESMIVAMGGATEASIWSNYHICKKSDIYERSIPYGVTLSNQSMYVLDYRGEHCPVNVEGDLYIGGDGLAKGYINNEELTSASFIYVNGMRLYKTGDIAKVLASGEIEFLGRKDRQVKINGFRVELGEIEVVLNKLDLVKSSVALLNDNGVLSCLIISDKFEEICEFEIKEYLGQYLPEYMIPKIIIIKAKMPLTTNGKVDYKSLKKDLSISEKEIKGKDKSFIDDNITNALVKICESNLKTEHITVSDNLYNLGADSLIIAQIAGNIRDYVNDLGLYEYIEFDKLLRELINKPEIYNLRSFIEKYKIFNTKDNIHNFEEDDSIGQMNYILDKDNEYLQVFLHADFGTLNCYRYVLENMKKENMSSIVGFTIKNSEKYCLIDSEKVNFMFS